MKNEEKTLNSNSNNKNWMNIEQIGRLCGVIVVYGLALDITHFCGYFHLSHFWTRRERYFTSGTSEQKSYLNFTWIEKFSAKWIIWSSFCLFVSFDFRLFRSPKIPNFFSRRQCGMCLYVHRLNMVLKKQKIWAATEYFFL